MGGMKGENMFTSADAEQPDRRLPPAAIEIGQQCGSLLSVARSILCTKHVPNVGEKWQVNAYISDEPDKIMIEAMWYELSCEIELTVELIEQARIMARDYETASHPMAWFTMKDRIAVMLKDDPADSYVLRTDEQAMNEIVLDADSTFHPWFSDSVRLGVLNYLAKWEHHIPAGESRDYYRGLCHGFRVALSVCTLVAKLPPRPPELDIREELLRYLESKSAERGIGRDLPPLPFLEFRPVVPVKEVLRRNLLKSFRTDPAEILSLASMVDEWPLSKRKSAGTVIFEGRNPKASAMEFIAPGECLAFYTGAVHALRISERIAELYETKIIPQSMRDMLPLQEGLHRLCCLAAHYWVELNRGSEAE